MDGLATAHGRLLFVAPSGGFDEKTLARLNFLPRRRKIAPARTSALQPGVTLKLRTLNSAEYAPVPAPSPTEPVVGATVRVKIRASS